KVRSMRYRPQAEISFFIFLVTCCLLGWCGANPPDAQIVPGASGFTLLDSNINSFVWLSRLGVLSYFSYFLLVMPILGLTEKTLPVPESISTPVLSHAATVPAGAT